MNRFIYSVLFYLALPIIVARLFWRGRKAPAYRKRIAERFGRVKSGFRTGGICVHAVSVGESIAAAPMIRELIRRYPDLPITVTCMTPTGSERIGALFGDQVQHCYLPYDLPCAVSRFLRALQPRLVVIVETELWPNLIHQCHRQGIAVALANGRLSERSAKGYQRFAALTQPMLAELDWLAVQSQVEAERFCALGARSDRVTVTGSIKYDLSLDADLAERAAQLRHNWGAEQRFVWIAASTHAGEDEIILQAHRRLLAKSPEALLMLVPRHPERFASVAALTEQMGFSSVTRASAQVPTTEIQVLVGDTMGELLFLYALADVAFVGGSLVANGGHNLLEPAALAKPVLSGPHLFNFQDISQRLLHAQALQVVLDEQRLGQALCDLEGNPAACERMGAAGLQVIKDNQGALQALLAGLQRLLDR